MNEMPFDPDKLIVGVSVRGFCILTDLHSRARRPYVVHLKLERSEMIHASSNCTQSDEEGIKVLFFSHVTILFSICRKTKQQASSQFPLKPVCQKV